MVLVDTTVWVDLFRGVETDQVEKLEQLIEAGEDICTCGPILTEVLQGVRDQREYRSVRERFDDFRFLPLDRDTYIRAAEIHRRLRKKGVTVRRPIDCIIAAAALDHDVGLLHNDRDFEPMARHCGLKVVL